MISLIRALADEGTMAGAVGASLPMPFRVTVSRSGLELKPKKSGNKKRNRPDDDDEEEDE